MQLSPAQTRRTVAARTVARLSAPTAPGLILVIGGLMAAVAGGIALARGFDGLYGQDAYAYFDYGAGSVRNSLLHMAPLEAFFWPPGYPLLVALSSFLLGPIPLAGQLVSLLMGALVPVFTGLLVHELWPEDPWLSVLAAGIVAVCGQLWQSSIVVMSDTTGLALATFSAWSLVRYARSLRAAWIVLASAAIAYATLARWIYGLVAIPFAVYAVLVMLERGRGSALPPFYVRGGDARDVRGGDARGSRTNAVARNLPVLRGLMHAALAVTVAVLILAPVVAVPLLGLITHPSEPAAFAGNFQVYSWSPLNMLRRDFFTADGHLAYSLPNGIYYSIAPANPAFFGPLLAVWMLPGLWGARQWPLRISILLLGWAAVVFAFHAGAPWQNFRFTLAYLPPLAILAAWGIRLALRWLGSAPRFQTVVVTWTVLGLLVGAGFGVRLVERFINSKDQELALVRWVQSQTPGGAQLFSFGPTLAFRHYSSLTTFDLFDVTPVDIGQILAEPAPDYVLVDTTSIEGQWLNQAPWSNFHLLRDDPGLSEIGTAEGYTLFRVGATAT